MLCPNCGAEMKEGLLYCEQCGEDIHIVPDFEPEIEYNLEQTIYGIVKEIHIEPDEKEETIDQQMEDDEDAAEPDDWDLAEDTGKPLVRVAVQIITTILVLAAVFGIIYAVSFYRHNNAPYQIEKAQHYTSEQNYDKAITHYIRALELMPDDIDVKFALAEVYFLKNNKIEYEYLLRDIVKDSRATVEQLESAYGKLIAIYRARSDYDTINELLQASNNESIKSAYQGYIAMKPEFSIKEGYYNTIQPLKLTTFGTGKIYYTMDGSDPDEHSQLYTAPILLESGEYCIKAVYINENNIASEIVTQNYYIEIEWLSSPEISVVSGDYNFPIPIEVQSEYEVVYYTMDGSDPDEHSLIYNGPISMPLGESVFKFICIEDGRKSEIVERYYNLTLNTSVTPEDAVNIVIDYAILIDKIYDAAGFFNEEINAAYRYRFQSVLTFNGSDAYYVVAEYYKDPDDNLTKTGNLFAVHIYNKKLFKIHSDANQQMYLEEIILSK